MTEIKRAPKELAEAFKEISTCNISDALDKLGLPCGTFGIRPLYRSKRIAGTAVTMKVVPFGSLKTSGHMGADPLDAAQAGDVLVIDNGGRVDQNCWGEIVTYAALQKGVVGVVIDGAARDVDITEEMGFPVYARGIVPHTARNRNVQGDFNCPVKIGTLQVNPGEIVVADVNGVCVIPVERAEEVLKVSRELVDKENGLIERIKKGVSFRDVDKASGYDTMLNKK
ncbi:MAG: RraA family protein [Deltaproteobacteria bacterium]|nr:RraA family protein [Deltaproteobacteria bacterium]